VSRKYASVSSDVFHDEEAGALQAAIAKAREALQQIRAAEQLNVLSVVAQKWRFLVRPDEGRCAPKL
jgi:hypothetical protein